jgi:hypothetical protein
MCSNWGLAGVSIAGSTLRLHCVSLSRSLGISELSFERRVFGCRMLATVTSAGAGKGGSAGKLPVRTNCNILKTGLDPVI